MPDAGSKHSPQVFLMDQIPILYLGFFSSCQAGSRLLRKLKQS